MPPSSLGQLDPALLGLIDRAREPLLKITDLVAVADHVVVNLTTAVAAHDDLERVLMHQVGKALVLVCHEHYP